MSKIKLEDIVVTLEEKGWKVLSTSYTNLDTPMEFQCGEGHKITSTWKKLRDNFVCPVCALNATAKFTDEVKPKKKGVNRVLALDQATHTTGYSIFDGKELINYGIFETQQNGEGDRYVAFRNWLLSIYNLWKPDHIYIEGIQFQENLQGHMGVTTFEVLARLQGVIIELCTELNVPYSVVPTNTWRGYVGVKGRTRADKKISAQELVRQAYGIEVTNDEADGILIGKYGSDKIVHNTTVVSWE